MPAEKLSMRKIKEVLRLKFELGFANRQIARSCKVSHSTVADYLQRAEAAGLNSWPLPADLDETGLEARLFPPTEAAFQPRSVPNWPAPSTKTCTATSTSRCSCCGRNISRPSQAVTNTADSASSTATGPENWIWYYGKSTAPEKNCLSVAWSSRMSVQKMWTCKSSLNAKRMANKGYMPRHSLHSSNGLCQTTTTPVPA